MARTPDTLSADDLADFMRRLKNTIALAEEGAAIKKALSSFGGLGWVREAGPATRRAGPVARGAGRRKRGKAVEPEKVLAVLKGAAEGISVGNLAKKLNADRGHVAPTLQRLRANKQAKLKGERSKALWFAA